MSEYEQDSHDTIFTHTPHSCDVQCARLGNPLVQEVSIFSLKQKLQLWRLVQLSPKTQEDINMRNNHFFHFWVTNLINDV